MVAKIHFGNKWRPVHAKRTAETGIGEMLILTDSSVSFDHPTIGTANILDDSRGNTAIWGEALTESRPLRLSFEGGDTIRDHRSDITFVLDTPGGRLTLRSPDDDQGDLLEIIQD